jgi:hypothetical protein
MLLFEAAPVSNTRLNLLYFGKVCLPEVLITGAVEQILSELRS